MDTLIREIEVRTLLTTQARTGRGIPTEYTINPYRGCLFSCKYCYARKFVYEDAVKKADWGRWIEVKKNAVEALGRESHKIFGREVFIGSATDPYQPIETKVGLTRALLEVLLAAYPARVHLQTRSPHVVRDLELFRRFGDTLTIGVSIPTDSDVVRKAFEPRAPSIGRRLKAAQTLHAAGIRVRATIAPLLPGTPQRLARLLQGNVEKAWVGTIQFYEQEEALRAIYAARGWERYLHRDFAEATKAALAAAGLRGE